MLSHDISELLSVQWFSVASAVLLSAAVFAVWRKRKPIAPSSITLKILSECDQVEDGCKAICEALATAPVLKDEKKCAEQMRGLVMANHLSYSSLVSAPEHLLRANRHISTSDHGALGTRFTVQYNLFAGSIVALGTDTQRETLFATQAKGELGCFAFTEVGAGVLSGAGVETIARYDANRGVFSISSPTSTATKTWISQGMFAEHAVILATIVMPDGSNKGPHLFFSRIQNRDPATGKMTPINKHITLTSLPQKTALWGLDNAYITFDEFEVQRTQLLGRFSHVDENGVYQINLPKGNRRMLDLLISRLLTGRVCLSEYTVAFALSVLRESYAYASSRVLWQSRRTVDTVAPTMTDKPLIRSMFVRYSEALAVVASYIADTREKVAHSLKQQTGATKSGKGSSSSSSTGSGAFIPPSLIEAVCICKFVGTSFGVDAISVARKTLGARALMEESRLGPSSFVCNATCAAEGDNTIMELKVVGDLIKGGFFRMFPLGLMLRSFLRVNSTAAIACRYCYLIAYAFWLGKAALEEGQLLRDIAWSRAHLLVLDAWLSSNSDTQGLRKYKNTTGAAPGDAERITESYIDVLARFPTPVQF